jgi:hypothetical protein
VFSTDTRLLGGGQGSVSVLIILSGFRVEGRPPDHEALMLNTTANSSNNCTNPFHTYLAEDEFPLASNKNPDKLLRADGASDIKSSPHGSWNRTKSLRYFSGNNINVAVAVFINRYT